MADQVADKTEAAPAVDAPATGPAEPVAEAGDKAVKDHETNTDGAGIGKDSASNEENKDTESSEKPSEAAPDAAEPQSEHSKPAAEADAEMKDVTDTAPADEGADAENATETPSAKNKNRRKSTGGDNKAKTLNKKGSKARITHTDAQPGDHFLVKLKGFPAWPAIICDESMLPQALVSTRPVTAARPDGTYNENYAAGGKRVNDRTFPVMYLHTNEFGWVANTAFTDLSSEKASQSINDKMRKDLKAAFELAAEHHPVKHYKEILKTYQDEIIARQEAEKAAVATPKKSKKAKAEEEEEDVEMADATQSAKSKSKKRKADENTSTPQRSDSVKKPKIKLNTSSTPKTANGADAPKKEDSAVKAAKPAKKKSAEKEKTKDSAKESKMTPEERRVKREREVMFLRHKLQRGLLARDQKPQEDEMPQMSGYLKMLEDMRDLDPAIIKATKINKVTKALLKLEGIPREAEFNFQARSKVLLEKWVKILEEDEIANGPNGDASDKKPKANGAKDESKQSPKPPPTKENNTEADEPAKDDAKTEDAAEAPKDDEKTDAPVTASDAVEAAA